ncbi:MAG: GNAT family N-acetyltransferase [Pseudomonadota bacterium]|nr:GNAT family N-acetyltransferase [Pseudomonadota bacterium]
MKNGLTLRVEHTVDAFGPDWDALFEGGAGLQSSRPWFKAMIEAALPDSAEAHFLAIADQSGPLALVPMLAGPGSAWGSLTTPYTCLYQPLVRPGTQVFDLTLSEIGQYCRTWPVTRFEALDPDWSGLGLLRRSLASAGLFTRTFVHFGNWHEKIQSRSWDAYLAARPGALRETIRRRSRAAERAGVRVELHQAASDLPAALAAYETVYRSSWKQPEPFPAFNGALIRALADTGALRIGVMWSGEIPIAAQYWSVVGGTATVLKLAHDESYKPLSPGTVLTAATIQRLIEGDGVEELDFGRGDDGYKQNWACQRRLRIGLLAINARTLAGLRTLIAHDAGSMRRIGLEAYGNLHKGSRKLRRPETPC